LSDGNGNGSLNGHGAPLNLCEECNRPVDADGRSTWMGGPMGQKVCRSCKWGLIPLEKGQLPETRAKGLETRRRNAALRRRPTEIIQERVELAIEKVIAPYFAGLEEKPDPNWSPRTRLQFYNEQSQLSEKLLNRAEGLPVARTRTVDANDEDVLPPQFQHLPPDMLERVIVNALAGRGGEIVDAEVVDEQPGE
jgi:hypothetical protein